jgi:multiple sugar transport system substrate-binding protein
MKQGIKYLWSVVAILAVMLAGCAGQPTPTEQTASESQGAAAQPAADQGAGAAQTSAEAVELTVWDWYVSQSPGIDKGIEAFQAANPNIKITRTVGQNQEDLTKTALQADSGPDVFMAPYNMKEAVDNGWLYPLSQFSDFEQFKANFPEPERNFVEGSNTFDGATYSAPFEAPVAGLQLWLNTKIYQQAGLVTADGTPKAPTTFDAFLSNARTIKEKTGKYALGLGNADAWQPIQFLMRLCVRSGAPDPGVGYFFDFRTGAFNNAGDPCLKPLLEMLVTMKNEQLINPDFQSLTDENIKARFAEGEVAMIVGGSWLVNGWKDTHPEFKEYTATGMPLLEGETATHSWYGGLGGQFYAINAKTQHPEAAWKFIKFIYSEDFGKIWTENGNGLSLFTPGDPAEYAENDAMRYILSSSDEVIPSPAPAVRNPDVTTVQINVQGPGLPQLMTGILTGQLTDIDAALQDLDTRLNAALEQGINDAAAAGKQVSREDYIFADWDPSQPYITEPRE